MRVDPLYHLALTGSLEVLTGRENKLSAELSSGLRVANPSDDPAAAAQSVRLGSAAAADDAYTRASIGVQSRLQVADSALGNVVTQVTSAIALTVQALNGTLDTANVQAIGQQLAGLRDEVVTLANTSYAGSYLFSGTASSTQPYTVDPTTTPPAIAYNGDSGAQKLATPGGQQLAVSLAGNTVFSASGADVLSTLSRLAADFSAGTSSSTTQADLAELRSALTNVTTQRAVLGNSLNIVEQSSTYAATDAANQRAAQSALVGADSTQVATDLSTTETQQKALLSVIANVGKQSLFDYIQ